MPTPTTRKKLHRPWVPAPPWETPSHPLWLPQPPVAEPPFSALTLLSVLSSSSGGHRHWLRSQSLGCRPGSAESPQASHSPSLRLCVLPALRQPLVFASHPCWSDHSPCPGKSSRSPTLGSIAVYVCVCVGGAAVPTPAALRAVQTAVGSPGAFLRWVAPGFLDPPFPGHFLWAQFFIQNPHTSPDKWKL